MTIISPMNDDITVSADGIYFCSKRCGNGRFCLKADYDIAVREAETLAARMGNGWEARVFENLGWHYEVQKDAASIHVYYDRSEGRKEDGSFPLIGYSAWICPGVSVNNHSIAFIQHAETPEDALGFATQEARTAMQRVHEALNALFDDGGVS